MASLAALIVVFVACAVGGALLGCLLACICLRFRRKQAVAPADAGAGNTTTLLHNKQADGVTHAAELA